MNIILQNCIFSSKTQKKKYLDLIGHIGENLAVLADKALKKLDLPEAIYDELQLLRKIASGGARKRQQQQIAKMLREYDFAYDDVLKLIQILPNRDEKIILLAQIWVTKLVEQEVSIAEFLTLYNIKDKNILEQLVLNSNDKEEDYNLLVKFIRKIISQYMFL